ncbi:MAG: UDP-N-acetylmuramoyl-L-alanine--D-glutamate ligase [Frankiaceae bacterium]
MTPSPGRDRTWTGRRICVTGLGLSGAAAARALLGFGAAVTVVDAARTDAADARAAELRSLGARVLLGPDQVTTTPAGTELVVTSPGWRPDQPLLVRAAAAGIPVWGEVELAWRLRPLGAAPWLAVTGTNGKTTTVRMLAAILAAAGRRTIAAGNVGVPLVDAVLAEPPYDVLAVELSSFQLHWTRSVRPLAAAILNVADDHRDWHGSFEAYAAAKQRIWGEPADADRVRVGIGNADDAVTATLLNASPAGRAVSFTLSEPAVGQLGVVGGVLLDRGFTDTGRPAEPESGTVLASVPDVRPPGPHNVANALAAAALARAYGVPASAVRDGLRAVVPDGHRNALVAVADGVTYVDDSKATNPHAAMASLAGYQPVVWIAGGLLKDADVEQLVSASAPRLRAVVLIGRDKEPFRAALARHAPQLTVVEAPVPETGAVPGAQVMTAAVAAAAALARPGDTVLLAPAAASMDQFRDYADRGDAFAAAVRGLTPGGGG